MTAANPDIIITGSNLGGPATLNILIIGSGIGGLTTALALARKHHNVTVLESTATLSTIGGGISIPPNSMKCMQGFGMLERLYKADRGCEEEREELTTNFVRYDGKFLFDGRARGKLYEFRGMNIHRANLQKALLEAVKEAGVVIHTNARVVDIDESGASPIAITKDGRWEADLIIGADGIKSTVRQLICPDVELQSSINCYRAVIPGSILAADPDLAPLLKIGQLWWGPHCVIVGIPVQNGAYYSFEATHPGNTGTAGEWNKKGDKEQFKDTYKDFEPRIEKLIDAVNPDDILVWKLAQLSELESWVGKSGKIVLIGDAAHALLPHSAQGHAMAVEDSASLAECISRSKSTSDIPQALKAFESIRKPRVRLLSAFGLRNAHTWQLPDGEEQEKRDEMFRNMPMGSAPHWDGKHVDEIPGLLPDPLFWPWLFGHDAVDFTNRRLDEIWK